MPPPMPVHHQGAPVQTQPFYPPPQEIRQRPKPQTEIAYQPYIVQKNQQGGTNEVRNPMQQQQSPMNGMSASGEEY